MSVEAPARKKAKTKSAPCQSIAEPKAGTSAPSTSSSVGNSVSVKPETAASNGIAVKPGAGAASSSTADAKPPEGEKNAPTDAEKQPVSVAFLRLASECQSSSAMQLVYLDRDEVSFGRLPTSTVVLDSTRAPQMISRTHAFIRRNRTQNQQEWVLSDNKSLNGVMVNGEHVTEAGRTLQPRDVITFGRKMTPPEFEYVYEDPHGEAFAAAAAAAVAAAAKAAADAEVATAAQAIAEGKKTALKVADIHSELACSICQDWLVHAATIECSHTFCWECIDKWLLQKKFECPVCRALVRREPVRTRAVDAIVQKTVENLPQDQKEEHPQRVNKAEAALAKHRKQTEDLEKSVNEATKRGKAFFHITSDWKKKEKDTFQRGVKDYTGNTRETYCRLIGLTVQWVHSADESMLNQALHNLALPTFASSSVPQIRERLLMFLRYG